MTADPTPRRVFQLSDQLWFAELSGDYNPMHIDPVAARRTQAGQPVVHGVHGALWALNKVADTLAGATIASLDVRFEQFIALGQPVTVEIAERTDAVIRIQIKNAGSIATHIVAKLGDVKPAPEPWAPAGSLRPFDTDKAALTPDFTDIGGMEGTVGFARPADAFAEAFPELAKAIGGRRIAAITTVTRLVGMVCPGLHSIFRRFSVSLVDDDAGSSELSFRVKKADERLRITILTVAGGGISGTVDCAVRQPPVSQPTTASLKPLLPDNIFADVEALIVGGSRGLGELTAKLIAAGGGKSIITYAVGRTDAEAVANDIKSAGGACEVHQVDASKDFADQLSDLPFTPNQLYYFATPRIFRQKNEIFSPEVFDEFTAIYATAFYNLCIYLQPKDGELAVYYPSSVAVAERPRDVTEYAMAKVAGEALCEDINRFLPGVSVHYTRLPRLLTDQTATIAQIQTDSPIDIMLPIIKTMAKAE